MKQLISIGSLLAGLLSGPVAYAQPMSLVIGIDGMGFGPQGFSVASTPFMDGLINGTWQTGYNGAYSDQAFAGGGVGTPTEQATSSGPGWSTIHNGFDPSMGAAILAGLAVPEPGSLALSLTVAGMLLVQRGRRR